MVEHFKRGISYRYFTSLLVVIGIVLPGRSAVLYCVQTWLPNLLYLGFLGLKAVLNYSFYEPILQSIFYAYQETSLTADSVVNYTFPLNVTNATDSNDNDNAGTISIASTFFFIVTFLYRLLLFTFLFFKRKSSWDIRRELNVIKHNFKQPDHYKSRVRKFAFLYLFLITWLYGSLLTVDFFEVADTVNINYPLWFTATVLESLGSRLNEAVCAFAVEGFLLYYSLALGYHLEELSETIRLVSVQEFTESFQQETNGTINMVDLQDTTTPFADEESGLQPIRKFKHIRMTLSSIHEIFKKCNRFLSPLLAISMLHSVVTLCFVIFLIDTSEGDSFAEPFSSFLYLILIVVVSFIKIALTCVVCDYCHNKVTRAYSHITGLKLSGQSVSRLSQEVALLCLSHKVFSFRFSLGGICKLRKALLPTIAGAVITFALIISQD